MHANYKHNIIFNPNIIMHSYFSHCLPTYVCSYTGMLKLNQQLSMPEPYLSIANSEWFLQYLFY